MTQVTNSFLKSTSIVIIISAIIGFGGLLLTDKFLSFFLISFGLQYILYLFVGDMIKRITHEKTIQLELEKLENLSTILQCSYCNKKNLVIFTPNQEERIEFDCEDCKKKNLVSVQFVVARTTEPINTGSLTNISFENEPKR